MSESDPVEQPRSAVLANIEREALERHDYYQRMHDSMVKLPTTDLLDALNYPADDMQAIACRCLRSQHLDGLTESDMRRALPMMSRSREQANAAGELLAAYGGPCHDWLASLVTGEDIRLAARAALALLTGRDDLLPRIRTDAVILLLNCIGHDDPEIWSVAQNYFGNHLHSEIAPWLREHFLDKTQTPKKRRDRFSTYVSQVTRLHKAVRSEDQALFQSMLNDDEASMRAIALGALNAYPSSDSVVQKMIRLCDDPHEWVRSAAVSYLGRQSCEGMAARQAMRARTQDGSERVLLETLMALARLDDRDATPWLMRVVKRQPDANGIMSDTQVMAARMVARWAALPIKVEVVHRCGFKSVYSYELVQWGKRLGGEREKELLAEANAMDERDRKEWEAIRSEENRKNLSDREKVLEWWEQKGRRQYPTIYDFAVDGVQDELPAVVSGNSNQ